MADETEQAIAAISAAAKQARKPTPRWVWLLAAVLGVGGAIAFAVAMLATPDPSTPSSELARAQTGRGFGAGLVIGLVAGIGIGVAFARQRAAHSSRNNP